MEGEVKTLGSESVCGGGAIGVGKDSQSRWPLISALNVLRAGKELSVMGEALR